jgi:hypothetical protein
MADDVMFQMTWVKLFPRERYYIRHECNWYRAEISQYYYAYAHSYVQSLVHNKCWDHEYVSTYRHHTPKYKAWDPNVHSLSSFLYLNYATNTFIVSGAKEFKPSRSLYTTWSNDWV